MKTPPFKEIKPSLDDLFQDLAHPNPNINNKACLDMIKYWPEASIERLIGNLSHKDLDLRRKSVKALGHFGDAVMPDIVKIFLTNKSTIVRSSCLKVLIKVVVCENYNSFPNSLIKVVSLSLREDNPEINLAVVCLLRQLGKHGLKKLIEISSHKNILIAKASITAIGEIDDPSSIICLKELSTDLSIDKLLRESASNSLEFKENFGKQC